MTKQQERTNPDQEIDSNKAIILQPNEVVKFDPETDIAQGQKAAKALMKLIKLTKPLKLGGKDYLYFEHWITIARFFNATVGIEWTRQTATGWEAKAIVHQGGEIIGSAEAACNNDEANWKNKPDFQRKSMAQTRACSKALRQIFGYIPVLVGISATPAEELDHEPTQISTSDQTPPTSPNSASNKELKATDKQIKFIYQLMTDKDITTLDVGNGYMFSKDEAHKLTLRQAKKIIDLLLKKEDEIPTITVEEVV